MTKAGDSDTKLDKKGRRSDRLAAALRQNLRRRKTQVRQRDQMAPPGAADKPKGT